MDDEARDICTCLAEDLRDLFGHNVYFDLKHGRLQFVVFDCVIQHERAS